MVKVDIQDSAIIRLTLVAPVFAANHGANKTRDVELRKQYVTAKAIDALMITVVRQTIGAGKHKHDHQMIM